MAAKEVDLKIAFYSNNTSAMYTIIKGCLPAGSNCSSNTNRLKDENGDVTATYTESRQIVQNYFCTVFDGKLCPLASVIADNREATIFDIRRGKELPFFEHSVVPSFHAIGCKCAHRRPM